MNQKGLRGELDPTSKSTTLPSDTADPYNNFIAEPRPVTRGAPQLADFYRRGPKVDVCPLRPEHVPALWAATMAQDSINAKLFKQTYGMSCSNADMLASIIHARRREQTHFSFVAVAHSTGTPSHWMTLHFPADGSAKSVIVARFLESRARTTQQVEALYLVLCHLFDELHYETVEIRRPILERDHNASGSWLLADVWRRSLLDPAKSGVSDVCVLPSKKWAAARLAAEAYIWMGWNDEVGEDPYLSSL